MAPTLANTVPVTLRKRYEDKTQQLFGSCYHSGSVGLSSSDEALMRRVSEYLRTRHRPYMTFKNKDYTVVPCSVTFEVFTHTRMGTKEACVEFTKEHARNYIEAALVAAEEQGKTVAVVRDEVQEATDESEAGAIRASEEDATGASQDRASPLSEKLTEEVLRPEEEPRAKRVCI